MEENATLPTDPADLRDRLERADLVVSRHDRDEERVLTQGGPHRFGIDSSCSVHVNERDGESHRLQPLYRTQDRIVFHFRRDHVPAAPRTSEGRPDDSKVVRLGCAGGKHDLVRADAERVGHRLSALFDGATRLLAEAVEAGRVAVANVEVRRHRIDDRPSHLRRRAVV